MNVFISQEVEQAANKTGYDFDEVIEPAHNKDYYRLPFGEFVLSLVKTVREQQLIVDMQQKQIEIWKDRGRN